MRRPEPPTTSCGPVNRRWPASAHEEAAEHWEAALDLEGKGRSGEPDELEQRAQLLLRLADLRYETGRYDRTVTAHLDEALQLFTQLGDTRRMAQTHSRLGRSLITGTSPLNIDVPRALDHYRRAEAILAGGGDDAGLGYVHAGLALASLWGMRPDDGLAASDHALEVAVRLGNDAAARGGDGATRPSPDRPRFDRRGDATAGGGLAGRRPAGPRGDDVLRHVDRRRLDLPPPRPERDPTLVPAGARLLPPVLRMARGHRRLPGPGPRPGGLVGRCPGGAPAGRAGAIQCPVSGARRRAVGPGCVAVGSTTRPGPHVGQPLDGISVHAVAGKGDGAPGRPGRG